MFLFFVNLNKLFIFYTIIFSITDVFLMTERFLLTLINIYIFFFFFGGIIMCNNEAHYSRVPLSDIFSNRLYTI